MDFNPLAKACPAIQNQIDGLRESEKQVTDELQWYSSIDPRALGEDLLNDQDAAEKLQSELGAVEMEIQQNAVSLRETESTTETLIRTRGETTRQIESLQETENQLGEELIWYSSIDPSALANDLSENESTAEKLRLEVVALEKAIQENAAQIGEIEPTIGTLFNPLNWFAKDQAQRRRRRTQLRNIDNQKAAHRQSDVTELDGTFSRIATLSSVLQRYGAFDLPRRQIEVQQIKNAIAGKKVELSIIGDRIAREHEMLIHLREIGNQKTARRESNVKELKDTRARMVKLIGDLQRHRTFDVARRQSELSQIKRSIAAKIGELAIVADRKRRIDELLKPLIQEIQNLESRKRHAQLDRDAAEGLDRQLSSAGNSYERAMIHEQCERKFGVGSPRKIIGDREKEIRQAERDYDKAKRRVEDIAGKAARKIDTIVIDGNNLCYEGNTFIGLSAIETLVPLLARISSVIVVFDSAIRRMLNTDDSGIQKRLGSHAKVHIVASRRLADETVLDLASASKDVYVLSNDRFGDFNEKPVVRDGRIIRHEIVNGNIFVHDLQLRVAYLAESVEGV